MLEDVIKHVVMYGTGNSCRLSCSISVFFSCIYMKVEKNLVNFSSINYVFMSFVLFSSLYFGTLCFPGRVLLLNFEYGSRDDSLSPHLPEA